MKKGMATHSSVLAWRIQWKEEIGGGLQSIGSQRVGYDSATNTHTHTYTKQELGNRKMLQPLPPSTLQFPARISHQQDPDESQLSKEPTKCTL